MDFKNISGRDARDGALPSVAHNVRILLVGHDTTSLMSLVSHLEQHSYKVSTTESAKVALSLFGARKNYYNIVIADLGMPETEIYELVLNLHCQPKKIPVILMVEDRTMDLAMKALDYGECYLLQKPLSHDSIATLWQHIYRVTGEMPTSLTETRYVEIEKYGNPGSGSSCDAGASNQNWRNSKRKLINTDIENIKGTNNQIAKDSSSEDDGCNSKKSRLTWTSSPYFKGYRDQKRDSVNLLQKNAGPVMPTMRRAAPMSVFLQRQTSGTNLDYVAARVPPQIPRSPSWLKPPNFVGNFAGYTLDYVKEKLDAWNRERAGVTGDVKLSSNQLRNGFQASNQELGGATGWDIPANGHPSNGLQALNQKSAGDSGMGMFGFGNAGNPANMKIHNVGEGTSTNQEYDGMPINDNIKHITQDTEAVKHLESTSEI